MNTVEEQSAAASETVHFATFDLSRGKWSGAQGKYSREHLWVYLSDSIQEIASEELQTMEMEFGQGLRIAANRGRQQLLPERWIALPSRAQLVTMPCGGALHLSRAERGDPWPGRISGTRRRFLGCCRTRAWTRPSWQNCCPGCRRAIRSFTRIRRSTNLGTNLML